MNASTDSKQLTFFHGTGNYEISLTTAKAMPKALSCITPTPSLKTLREQPGDRVLKSTAESSALDLLSAVLGDPDTALRLLSQYPTLSELAHASPANLQRVKGVGRRGAARIKASLELGRRSLAESPDEQPQIRNPSDAAPLFISRMSGQEQEEMHVMLLNTRNRVQGIHTVYKGSLNTTMVRVGELFREAVRDNCAALIVAHSHPSGDPSPSPVIWRKKSSGKDGQQSKHPLLVRSSFQTMYVQSHHIGLGLKTKIEKALLHL